MELVEIRELDGPNRFLLQPTIKLELRLAGGEQPGQTLAALRAVLDRLGFDDDSSDEDTDRDAGFGTAGASPGVYAEAELGDLGDCLVEVVAEVHRRVGAPAPISHWVTLDTPGHIAVAFGWERRRFARAVAEFTADLALARADAAGMPERLSALTTLLHGPGDDDDRPALVRDEDRTRPIVGVTGTNGKTTTTRLIAHILRGADRRVGWSSTSGVYIEGEQVLEGDWTGPGGARRVLDEPGLDVAVLETARGGIVLRGLAYESNDVGVFINVSDDHLGLHGIMTVESLAQVKSTVVKVTRSGGFAVLNADDPLVRGVAGSVRASIFFVSQQPDNPTVTAHRAGGGHALSLRDGVLLFWHGRQEQALVPLADVPVTFGGRAPHMVENALCAAAACLAIGLAPEQVRDGLVSFRNSAEQNSGRLNVYDVDGVTVIADYAHNEAGLRYLLTLGRSLAGDEGRLTAVVGTAGDRTDDALRAIGRVAAEGSDRVIIKGMLNYLRGRAPGEMDEIIAAGIADAGATEAARAESEVAALGAALVDARPGDVVAMMAVDQPVEVAERLREIGRPVG
ncbi:MAG: Cyanophycin synthase(EC [uncultured Thermomicrobiales bacterium]|uniref:Cyanophycin synthase(EC) n=1 Tax=uncultured Thermomicrobiales bacterium TaxID=1645740 RepID=A0A6J4TUR8_9BACT|nr:MAG: Cyanophycin synthase(EC [uncultured Thermomicrobiales bacterium]